MSNVYVIQRPYGRKDFSSALNYGKLVFVLDQDEHPSTRDQKPIVDKLEKTLENFQDEDYLVWAGGDPLSSIIAGQILADLGMEEYNYLKWEKNSADGKGYYMPVKVKTRWE